MPEQEPPPPEAARKRRKHMGRKTLLTPEITHKFTTIIANHNTLKTACQALNISEQTFYNWMELGEAGKQPYLEFFESVNKAKAHSKMLLIQSVAAAAPKDYRAAALLLKLLYPKEFTENPTQIENNVTVATSVTTHHETKDPIIVMLPPAIAMRPPRPRTIQILDAVTGEPDPPEAQQASQ